MKRLLIRRISMPAPEAQRPVHFSAHRVRAGGHLPATARQTCHPCQHPARYFFDGPSVRLLYFRFSVTCRRVRVDEIPAPGVLAGRRTMWPGDGIDMQRFSLSRLASSTQYDRVVTFLITIYNTSPPARLTQTYLASASTSYQARF